MSKAASFLKTNNLQYFNIYKPQAIDENHLLPSVTNSSNNSGKDADIELLYTNFHKTVLGTRQIEKQFNTMTLFQFIELMRQTGSFYLNTFVFTIQH